MRIRLSLSLDIERRRDPEPEQHEHRDNDGTLVERAEPHRIGFVPEHERRDPDERAR